MVVNTDDRNIKGEGQSGREKRPDSGLTLRKTQKPGPRFLNGDSSSAKGSDVLALGRGCSQGERCSPQQKLTGIFQIREYAKNASTNPSKRSRAHLTIWASTLE